MRKRHSCKERRKYLERRKREIACRILDIAVPVGKALFTIMITVAAYNFLSGIAFRERGYEAVGGELLAAVLFGGFVFYGISYVDFHIRKYAETKEDTI